MADHTPGPWHTGSSHHDYFDGTNWHVTVWADNGPEWGRCAAEATAPTREMAQANATLIAASLELLEACRQAVFAIPTTHGAFETVRAAIEKAEETYDPCRY